MKKEHDFLKTIAPEPGNLIKGLQLLQATEGYISEDGIRDAAEYFGRPVADVEGVVSFYAQFKRRAAEAYFLCGAFCRWQESF